MTLEVPCSGVYLVPFVKYPANPPSIGHPDTITDRSGLYLLMVVCSVIFLVTAVWLGQRGGRGGGMGTPACSRVRRSWSRSARLYSIAAQLILWVTIGLAFAPPGRTAAAPAPWRGAGAASPGQRVSAARRAGAREILWLRC